MQIKITLFSPFIKGGCKGDFILSSLLFRDRYTVILSTTVKSLYSSILKYVSDLIQDISI
jgi:hypothetical protein